LHLLLFFNRLLLSLETLLEISDFLQSSIHKLRNIPETADSRKTRQQHIVKSRSYQNPIFHPFGSVLNLYKHLNFFATFAPAGNAGFIIISLRALC
jgi:hypothetical protein